MYCEVFPLRRDGVRLSNDEARSLAVRGYVKLTEFSRIGMPESRASVTAAGGQELLVLKCAHVRRIERSRLIISGFLDLGRSEPLVRQTWCCVVQQDDVPAANGDSRKR